MSSLQAEVQGIISKYIEQYITVLSSDYGINNKELNEKWKNVCEGVVDSVGCTMATDTTDSSGTDMIEQKKVNKPDPVQTTDISPTKPNDMVEASVIMNANVSELKALCKARKLMTGGKKQDLIERLQPFVSGEQKPVQPAAPKKKKRSPNRMPQIPISSIQIKKNQYGNYEHPETKLIFNKETKQVIGKQKDNGDIGDLTDEDIQKCDQFKFSYVIPEKIKTVSEEAQSTILENQDDEIVETLEDIVGSDDDFEEFYESDE